MWRLKVSEGVRSENVRLPRQADVIASMGYARRLIRRHAAILIPVVLAVLPFLPLAFSFSALHPRVILAWVAEFKLLLLACGQGPALHPSLPLAALVSAATFPVALRQHPNSSAATTASASLGFVEHAVLAALLAAVASLYRYEEQMNEYVLLTLYTVHAYLALELVVAAAAATARALTTALDLDLEPQFDRRYLSASLRDFWGRRWNWNLSVSVPAVLRPVRALLGAPAGVLAAFAVSGLMHEAMFSYIIVLHGACVVAEGWWAAAAHEGCPRSPRALATALTLAFVVVTGFWLFFTL